MFRCVLLAMLVVPCSAQTAAPKATEHQANGIGTLALPAFEVACVKPTAHGRNAEGVSISSDPETPSPGTFVVTNNSLDELIRWAFRVKEYQVSGPKWLNDDSVCFHIEAKVPPGTSRAQLRSCFRICWQSGLN